MLDSNNRGDERQRRAAGRSRERGRGSEQKGRRCAH